MDPKTAAVLTPNRRSLSIPQMHTAIKANAQTIQKTVSEIWRAPYGKVVRSKSKNLPGDVKIVVFDQDSPGVSPNSEPAQNPKFTKRRETRA